MNYWKYKSSTKNVWTLLTKKGKRNFTFEWPLHYCAIISLKLVFWLAIAGLELCTCIDLNYFNNIDAGRAHKFH